MLNKYIEILKDKDVIISDRVISTGRALLLNSWNLNKMLYSLINRTNLFDQKDILNFFNIMKIWFQTLLDKNL